MPIFRILIGQNHIEKSVYTSCFWMELFMRQKMKQSELKVRHLLHWKQRTIFNILTPSRQLLPMNNPHGPQIIFPESSGCRFQTLAEQDLQGIEDNLYSNATKIKPKWGFCVFNYEYFTRMFLLCCINHQFNPLNSQSDIKWQSNMTFILVNIDVEKN